MFGRGVFLKGKNFHSIVIVVPLHVSKFYRVLKKLTAYSDPQTCNGVWLKFQQIVSTDSVCSHKVFSRPNARNFTQFGLSHSLTHNILLNAPF
jgi:hypothetical protein